MFYRDTRVSLLIPSYFNYFKVVAYDFRIHLLYKEKILIVAFCRGRGGGGSDDRTRRISRDKVEGKGFLFDCIMSSFIVCKTCIV